MEASGRRAWREAWREPRFRIELAVTAIAILVAIPMHASFAAWNEGRPGVVLGAHQKEERRRALDRGEYPRTTAGTWRRPGADSRH